jgi:methionyl-tRNA formyltransferase
MKIIFFGTGEFAIPCLLALKEKHEIVVCCTSTGRGKKPVKSPVMQVAEGSGIPQIVAPENPNCSDSIRLFRSHSPDLIVLVAYGHILSKAVLNIPKKGAINVHPSLLPRYRGAAPINWVIINGEKETGVTTFLMAEKLDAGKILLQERVRINEGETFGELQARLAAIGSELLLTTIEELGNIGGTPQNQREVSYAPMLTKKMRKIDWKKRAIEIVNLIHGLSPHPGAYCIFRGRRLILLRARTRKGRGTIPGKISGRGKGPLIETGDGLVEVLELKPEAKSKMDATSFINGYRPEKGEIVY